MSFASRLNILRLESKLTDSELAGLFGVSRQTVLNWADRKTEPTKRLRAFTDHAAINLCAAVYKGLLPLKDKQPNDPRLRSMRVRLCASYRDKI